MSLPATEVSDSVNIGATTFHNELPDTTHDTTGPTIRTLSLSNVNMLGTSVRITDADAPDNPILYTVTWNIKKPSRVAISAPDRNPNLGSITFHFLSTRIDIVINDVVLKISPNVLTGKKTKYTSPAFDNTTLTWVYKGHLKTFDLTCLDAQSLPVAKVSIEMWGVKKVGKFEICDQRACAGSAMDEIIATGMAVTEYYQILITNPIGLAATAMG